MQTIEKGVQCTNRVLTFYPTHQIMLPTLYLNNTGVGVRDYLGKGDITVSYHSTPPH